MNKLAKRLILFSIAGSLLGLSLYVKKNYDNYKIIKPKDNSIAIYVEGINGYEKYSSQSLPTVGYTFNTSESSCTNGATLNYDDNNKTLSVESISSNTQCNTYFDRDPHAYLSNYIIENVPIVTSGAGLYHHTSDTTAADYVANSAEDDSYRYAGAGGYSTTESVYDPSADLVANWVCFGESDGTNCSVDHQWRIIGVMSDGTVKMIKAFSFDTASKFDDDTNDGIVSNVWANSLLKAKINGTDFLMNSTYMNDTMRNMLVATPTWNIGTLDFESVSTTVRKAKIVYDNEILETTTAGGMVALMNPSDYGFAAIPTYWDLSLGSYNDNDAQYNDWLYSAQYHWTISPSFDGSTTAFFLNNVGQISDYYGYVDQKWISVRPVAFLKPTILRISGDGSHANMYTIN